MKNLRWILLLVIITLGLNACAGFAQEEREPLTVIYTDWPGDYVVWLAYDLGLFQRYGVEVEPVYYPSRFDAVAAFLTNQADGINIQPLDYLIAVQSDIARAVMATGTSQGADQIVTTEDIQYTQQLLGKRIGFSFGSYAEYLINDMLTRAGMNHTDVTLVNIAPEDVPAAIPELIDAGHTSIPYLDDSQQAGLHPVYSSSETPWILTTVFVFRKDIVADRPDDIQAFVRAWLEAADYWIENPGLGAARIAKYIGLGQMEITYAGVRLYSIEENRQAFEENYTPSLYIVGTGVPSIYYVTRLNLEFAIRQGFITLAPEIDLMFNPSFVP
ncbi:MAG: ABC transporter substrate-binding protein [Chloroflexota bacterium]